MRFTIVTRAVARSVVVLTLAATLVACRNRRGRTHASHAGSPKRAVASASASASSSASAPSPDLAGPPARDLDRDTTYFVDARCAWTYGPGATRQTTDGGRTWKAYPPPKLPEVFRVDGATCAGIWLRARGPGDVELVLEHVGDADPIWRQAEAAWPKQDDRTTFDETFVDDLHGFAVVSPSAVARTVDGGKSWSRVELGYAWPSTPTGSPGASVDAWGDHVTVTFRTVGASAGGPLARFESADGGVSFVRAPEIADRFDPYGDGSVLFKVAPGIGHGGSELRFSTDQGKSWLVPKFPPLRPATYGLGPGTPVMHRFGRPFATAEGKIAVQDADEQEPVMLLSDDRGASFRLVRLAPERREPRVFGHDLVVVSAADQPAAIDRSVDGGVTWKSLTPKLIGEAATAPAIGAIEEFAPQGGGIAWGSLKVDGRSWLARSTDDGATWIRTRLP
jgi:hypothetical protein